VKRTGEKGVVLPLVMIAVMVGALVIPPFLANVSTGLVSSRHYQESINAEYAADAGAEQAIWGLAYGGISGDIPQDGDSLSYALPESVNGLAVNLTVVNRADGYGITASAGGCTLNAVVDTGAGVSILSWDYQ
jgi:hypothetical protein